MNGPGDIPLAVHTGIICRSTCGLISNAPVLGMSSCCCRAKAFAQKLSSKLRTLGLQSETGECLQPNETIVNDAKETRWKSPENSSTAMDLQPLPLTSNSYDFDYELESPDSSTDECEYHRLFETDPNTRHNSSSELENSLTSSSTEISVNITSLHDHITKTSLSYRQFSSEKSKIAPMEINDFRVSYPRSLITVEQEASTLHSELTGAKCSDFLGNEMPSLSTETNSPAGQNFHTCNYQKSIIDRVQNHIKGNLNGNENLQHARKVFGYQIYEKSPLWAIDQNKRREKSVDIFEDFSSVRNKEQVDGNINSNRNENHLTKYEAQICFASEKHTLGSVSLNSTDDEDDCHPQCARRCLSLKTGKTPPGTPGRKKIVRFADVLGLDLADVKTFMDEIPIIPRSAFEDLKILEVDSIIQPSAKATKILMPLFQQPGCLAEFLDVILEKQVSLENAVVVDNTNQAINGLVRVRNLDFHKTVHIRYTFDNWCSFVDLQAIYVENSCDGFSDKFTFTIYANSLSIGQRLEFAVRYQCRGQQFWDNNFGMNYCFQCLSSNFGRNFKETTPFHQKQITMSTCIPVATETWCDSFY